MAVPYTKSVLVERIKKHISNNIPNDEMGVSDNEILLMVDQALAFNLVGQVWQNAKLEGSMSVPEGYVQSFTLTGIVKDANTGYWYNTLPQTPVSLPLGYSITDVYFAHPQYGKTHAAWPIENKRMSYREELPKPKGLRYWVEGSTIFITTDSNTSLQNEVMCVKMLKTRTASIDEALVIPDDAIHGIFETVVKSLLQRFGVPQDIVHDGLPAGSKAS